MNFDSSTRRLLDALREGDLATAFNHWHGSDIDEFTSAVETLTGKSVTTCDGCQGLAWGGDLLAVDDGSMCESCLESYTRCDRCGVYVSETESIHGEFNYCESCKDSYCTYCEDCDEWYRDCDEHTHNCSCEAPIQRFTFPADGHGTIGNDERLDVQLASGIISHEGLRSIRTHVYTYLMEQSRGDDGDDDMAYYDAAIALWPIIDKIGPEWQSRRGNFTKRLGKALYERGIKLQPEIISTVGNLARAHSSSGTDWTIKFTRDLNQSADEFYHSDSCWWGSYSKSRCALKSWGGLGMLSVSEENGWGGASVEGRCWVLPLDDDLEPTHRTDAFAYVVFNGYGNLEGFVGARIVAHLAGRSYRKVSLGASVMYVNGDSGYLVADQATCDETEYLSFGYGEHDSRDVSAVRRQARDVVVA